MRPLKLSMTAFGPFPGTEMIDFGKFGTAPLFLINGPTGSGKTTILDAICFALYGKTTGDEREAGQMRSDLAPVDTLCEVIFEFQLHDRHFEIRRVPEQQRPKSRGDGFTDQKPEAQIVEFLPGGGRNLLVASKVSDASREIENLTGLSADQFRQVMVLPQGKFRQLLLAESAQREKIFSQLFQTGIYKKLEERLKERSATIRRDRDSFMQQQKGILESIDCQDGASLAAELEGLKAHTESALKTKETAEQTFLKAHQDLTNAQALERDFTYLEQVTEKLSAIDRQQEEISQLNIRLSAGQQAGKLQPLFLQRERCLKTVAEARLKLEKCHESQRQAKAELNSAEKEQVRIKPLQQECDKDKIQLQQMEQYRLRLEQFDKVSQQYDELKKKTELHKRFRMFQNTSEKIAVIKQFMKQEKVLDNLKVKLEQAEITGRKTAEKVEVKRRECKCLELAWHQGQAALLAAELQDGKPCPVCGSFTHPHPAVSEIDIPGYQQLEDSRNQLSRYEEQLKSAREHYVELRAEVKQKNTDVTELKGHLGGDPRQLYGELESTLNTQSQQLACFSKAELEPLELLAPDVLGERLGELAENLAAADKEMNLLKADLPEAYRDSHALDRDKLRLGQRIAEKEQIIAGIIDRHRLAFASLEASATAVKDSELQLKQYAEDVERSAGVCEESLGKSSFNNENEYIQALLDEDTLSAMAERIELFSRERQHLVGAQTELKNKLANCVRPDLHAAQALFNEAQVCKDDAVKVWQECHNRLMQLQNILHKLEVNRQRLDKLDADYAVVGTLSDVASGQTGQKVSLQRFVLSVLLDDVLIEASTRLEGMSKGRYRLLRKEDRSKGNKASGLELMVDDAYTGKVRPVATLSGGESFMAALSLALGLSEVVQAYSGGVRLDTLFIDEGFGSLDSESLDLAIATLVDLQSGGRTIGLISHVSELKEQIPLRIDVKQERNGSHVKLICP